MPSPRWWLLRVAARLSKVWRGKETAEPAQGLGGSASCTFPGPLELLCKDALGHAQVCPVITASAVCTGSLYPQVCVKKGKYLQSDAQHTILTCIFLLKWLKSRICIRIPWSCDKFWGLGCTPDEQCELRWCVSSWGKGSRCLCTRLDVLVAWLRLHLALGGDHKPFSMNCEPLLNETAFFQASFLYFLRIGSCNR